MSFVYGNKPSNAPKKYNNNTVKDQKDNKNRRWFQEIVIMHLNADLTI